MLISCGSNPDTAPSGAATIVISSAGGSVTPGGTMQFSATASDANGDPVVITPVWTVVNGGGTITSGGLFTAGSTPGTFANTIQACVGTVCTRTTVVVGAAALVSITLTPDSASVATDLTVQFTAVGKDADGNVVAFTPTWTVISGGGTVSGTGLFTAGTVAANFAHTVRVSSGAVADTASVLVTAGPLATLTITRDTATLAIHDTLTFVAVGHDAHGNIVAVSPVWSVVGGGGSFAGALFTADTVAGVFLNAIHATVGAISATSSVTISAGALASIAITPVDPAVMTSHTMQFSATGHDAFGNVVLMSSPIWSVLGVHQGSITPLGLYTPSPNFQGHYINAIQATSDGVTGLGSVTVMCDASCS